MTDKERIPVVIIGAGPTGLSLAAQLVRYNVEFVLLEKAEGITRLSKAVVVQARSLEIFDELGIAGTAVKRGRITNAFRIYKHGRQRAKIDISGLGQGISAFPFALSLEQSKTEQLLYEYLAQNNRKVHWRSEFIRSEENSDSVTVHYKDEAGNEQSVTTSYLVSCEGAHSLLRRQIGAGFEGDTVPKLFYVADVTLNSPVINTSELHGFLIKKGFVLFFPMEGEGHYRLIGILPDRTDDNFTFKDIEQDIKDKIEVPVNFKELRWFSTYKVHSRMASRFMKGRCFIAGDSAHIHTPAGGQGMNTGIQDAYNLAWKLALVLKDELQASVLESYAFERMQNAKHLLHTTDRMFDMMAGITWFRDLIRSRIVPLVAGLVVRNRFLNKAIFPLISQTGIAYPDSPLTVKSRMGKVSAGDRMPYFLFRDGSSSYDRIKAPSFKLIFVGKEPDARFADLKAGKIQVQALVVPEAPADLFGEASGFYIVLRPDNHILYVGKSLSDCNNGLRRFTENNNATELKIPHSLT